MLFTRITDRIYGSLYYNVRFSWVEAKLMPLLFKLFSIEHESLPGTASPGYSGKLHNLDTDSL